MFKKSQNCNYLICHTLSWGNSLIVSNWRCHVIENIFTSLEKSLNCSWKRPFCKCGHLNHYYWAVPHHHWNEETLAEVNCCCQRCLATGEVGKEGEKGRRGVAVGLDKQVPTASWEGAVTWKRSIYLKKKTEEKAENALIKGNRGLRLNFGCKQRFVRTFYYFICFVFRKKNILKHLYKERNIFCVKHCYDLKMNPPSPNIWLKHRSTMSVKGKLLHFSEKLLTEFHCQCWEALNLSQTLFLLKVSKIKEYLGRVIFLPLVIWDLFS